MGSKKKNKKPQKKYPKKRTYREAFGKLSHSKNRGKKKCINSVKELDWQIKRFKNYGRRKKCIKYKERRKRQYQ